MYNVSNAFRHSTRVGGYLGNSFRCLLVWGSTEMKGKTCTSSRLIWEMDVHFCVKQRLIVTLYLLLFLCGLHSYAHVQCFPSPRG